MSKKNLQQCESGFDLAEYALAHGAAELSNNKHRILRLPNGKTEAFPNHRQALGKGLRCKIVKHLLAAGIALLLAIPIIVHFA